MPVLALRIIATCLWRRRDLCAALPGGPTGELFRRRYIVDATVGNMHHISYWCTPLVPGTFHKAHSMLQHGVEWDAMGAQMSRGVPIAVPIAVPSSAVYAPIPVASN